MRTANATFRMPEALRPQRAKQLCLWRANSVPLRLLQPRPFPADHFLIALTDEHINPRKLIVDPLIGVSPGFHVDRAGGDIGLVKAVAFTWFPLRSKYGNMRSRHDL